MPSTKTPQIKETKDGRLSFRLPDDLKQIITLAINYRLKNDLVPEYLHHLLNEAKTALRKEGKIRMRKSEFFAVFHPEQMRYFENSTITLIRAHLGELPSPTAQENNHFFNQQIYFNHE
jgi:hypothetical protein